MLGHSSSELGRVGSGDGVERGVVAEENEVGNGADFVCLGDVGVLLCIDGEEEGGGGGLGGESGEHPRSWLADAEKEW